MITLSDQQIVTGIAILASGYSQLNCGLSAYHWQMVVYLAWFSSLTHLTTLSFLRGHIGNNKRILFLRLSLMVILALMLSIAFLPTGSDYWLDFNSTFNNFAEGLQTL